ncbi:hypothetical protein [Kribbella speibonae]|uniref:SH3 domain-containing protein n=1 Tax=Kribbella speibonae TaxID=1572660 RepID=A0ABY2AAI7_9ACTN|nr:hypothetical protein [Kribbella speibonae]TCC26719.1 hypothetical protein E0H58_01435 [Kribbella speibonae]
MISDDLSTLFGAPAAGVRHRQGTVLTWDPDDGSNTIDVGGGTLTNVKVLSTGEAIALKAGHVVSLLGQGGSWWILGRVAGFGDPDFAGSSVAFETVASQASNFALTTGFTEITSTSLNVPAWADEALVSVSVSASIHNPRAVEDFAYLYAAISGLTSGSSFSGFAATGVVTSYDSLSHTHTATVSTSGPSTIAVSGYMLAQGAAWSATSTNRIYLAASGIYRSTV